jgi:phosphatidate cytidylyltransferase
MAAFFVLVPAWVAIITLHQHHPQLVLYLILLVASADTGAYFAGKAFGKNKLAPELSPGKTKEGMLGGLMGALVLSVFVAWYFALPAQDWFYFIALSVAVALISVAGDLFESLIKREAGQKDSGNILPGHGGILDRIDGLLAALPLFTLGIFWGAIQV